LQVLSDGQFAACTTRLFVLPKKPDITGVLELEQLADLPSPVYIQPITG
jgi:hypothetical protein